MVYYIILRYIPLHYSMFVISIVYYGLYFIYVKSSSSCLLLFITVLNIYLGSFESFLQPCQYSRLKV